jgi:hypothetical protein
MERVFRYLTEEQRLEPVRVAETLWQDYQRGGPRDRPGFLASYLPDAKPRQQTSRTKAPKRQARHLA